MSAKIVTVTGASGSGKTSLVRKCQNIFQKDVAEVVSVTTRPPRKYEIDAIDYYFVSEDDFKDLDFLESTEFSGYHYGIMKRTVDSLMKKHKVVFAIVDHHGAEAIKNAYKDDAISVFVHVSRSAAFCRVKNRDGEKLAKEREIADKESGLLDSEKDAIYDVVLSSNNKKRSVIRKFLLLLDEKTDLTMPDEWKL